MQLCSIAHNVTAHDSSEPSSPKSIPGAVPNFTESYRLLKSSVQPWNQYLGYLTS